MHSDSSIPPPDSPTRYQDPTAPYSGPEFYARYRHLKEPRRATSFDMISFEEFGWMLDTLDDLLHATLLLETYPRIPTDDDPTALKARELPPSYILDFFGNYQEGKSYFRPDKARAEKHAPQSPRNLKSGPAAFSEKLHLMSRVMGTEIFEDALWPPGVAEAAAPVEQCITEYQQAVARHGKDYTRIPPEEVAAFNQQLKTLLPKLHEAFATLGDKVKLRLPDKREVEIVNREKMHPNLSLSSTPHVLHQLKGASRAVANQQKVPEEYVIHSLDAIGAESMISDVMHTLMDDIDAAADDAPCEPLRRKFRATLAREVKNHARDLALFRQFHETVDMAYPLAYEDINRLLTMAGEPVEISRLETKEEIAVMLYAAGHRLRRDAALLESPGFTLQRQLCEAQHKLSPRACADTLLHTAQIVHDCMDMEQLRRWAGTLQPELLASAKRYALMLDSSPDSPMNRTLALAENALHARLEHSVERKSGFGR